MDQDVREMNPSGCSDASRRSETVIAVEAIGPNGKSDDKSVPSMAVVEDETCSIDLESDGGSQRICRICHLNAKESGKSRVELMEVGCGCKGELGVAHMHCAEAWFKVKGNRLCEICGEIARNITGVVDNGFMEEWSERSMMDGGDSSTSNERRRCLNGQPLCNLLMSCLVIAFVLPWFFRVNMF